MNFKIGTLLGRLSNGAQADHGKRSHAVVRKMVKPNPCPYNDFGKDLDKMKEKVERSVAMCGAKPSKKSVGWDFENYSTNLPTEVTCPRCLKRLEKHGL